MDAIWIKVKLTNLFDETKSRAEGLSHRGVRTYEGEARVDREIIHSVIPKHVLENLGVVIRGTRRVETAPGSTELVGLSEGIIFEALCCDTVDEALVTGDEIVIGLTAVNKLDLRVNRANRRSLHNPDRSVSKVK